MRCGLGWVKLVGHALTGSIEHSSMSELSVIMAATWNVGLRTWRAYWGQRRSAPWTRDARRCGANSLLETLRRGRRPGAQQEKSLHFRDSA